MLSAIFSGLLSKLGALKLTLTQYALLLLSGCVAVLAILLKFKEAELHQARVQLLQAHFDNENQRSDTAIEQAEERRLNAKQKYEDAIDRYRAAYKRLNS